MPIVVLLRFYPITNKSDVLSIFIKWQKYVERYFNKKIKMVQSDWGGEYRSLHKFLQNCSITHCVFCPHTHHKMVLWNVNIVMLWKQA